MRINQVEVENYGRFYKNFKFSFSEDESLTVFHAPNGVGKSTLYHAIGWAFDPSFTIKKNNKDFQPRRPPDRFLPTEENEVKTFVEVEFEHNGLEYLLRREDRTSRLNDGKFQIHTVDQSKSYVWVKYPGEKRQLIDFKKMQNALPPHMFKYAQFDGDYSLESYRSNGKLLRAIVYDLTNINAGMAAVKMAEKASLSTTKDYAKSLDNAEAEKHAAAVVTLTEKRNGALEDIKRITSELEALAGREKDLSLQASESEELKQIQELRNASSTQQKLVRNERLSLVKGLKANSRLFFKAIGYHIDFEETLKKVREQGDLPSPVRAEFVDRLIAEKECICERKIKEGEKPYKALMRVRESANDALSDLLAGLSVQIGELQKSGDRYVQQYLKGETQSIESWRRLSSKSQEVEAKFQEALRSRGMKQEEAEELEISDYKKRLKDLLKDQERKNGESNTAKQALEQYEKALKEAKQKLDEESGKTQGGENLKKLDGVAKGAYELLEEACDSLKKDAINEIVTGARKLRDRFFSAYANKFDFKITDDWILETPGVELNDLSAGEGALSAYCVILAVAQVTGSGGLPFLIDNPSSKLMPEYRVRVLESFPELFSQAIVFAHHGDLNKEDMDSFFATGKGCQQYFLYPDPEAEDTSNKYMEGMDWEMLQEIVARQKELRSLEEVGA